MRETEGGNDPDVEADGGAPAHEDDLRGGTASHERETGGHASDHEGDSDIDEDDLDDMELWLDDKFEPLFFQLRYFLLIPVIVSFIGSTIMFSVGAYDTYKAGAHFLASGNFGGEGVVLPLIKALDAFLLGIILVIFSFGVYDFFISKLDPVEHATIRPDWFKFDSIGELKNKIIEVVLVILAILFFEQMTANADEFGSPASYLVIPAGAAILAISLGFFKWATE